MTPVEFEAMAGEVMSKHFSAPLQKNKMLGHPKLFDFVSTDGQIVGDAKYYSLVRGQSIPPAKWSVVAEHVWFLEKVDARHKFLVFGNDRRVPLGWLQRWGVFVGDEIKFFFLSNEGALEELRNPSMRRAR